MWCCNCYTAFRLIVINLVIAGVNLVVNSIAFTTTQWAVSEKDHGSGCEEYLFIGLEQAKGGTNGCSNDDYEVEKIDCDDLDLDGDDCDAFESALSTAQTALACVILIFVYKALLLWMAHCNNHNRILWLLLACCAGGDIVFGSIAFAACGNFQSILDELPSVSSDDAELGYGWGLELLSGFLAYICAALAVVVLVKGIGDNKAADPPANVA